MENVITVINKIQDLPFAMQKQIELPQIVVVGDQSAGKSSTLESIVGHSFLPRGAGIVTRCPLVLQLFNCPMNDRKYRKIINGTDEIEEWGKFSHSDEIFEDFDKIREEIEARTDVIAGSNKGITRETINLQIYSPNVVNLTLVDLPGLTKISVGDQPKDIEKQIKDIVMSYVTNRNSIILAVSPANVDVATSEVLKIAMEADVEGIRTLPILTKLDKANDDVADILSGAMKLNIPVKLGIIGVMNRDTKTETTIAEQLDIEKNFLESKYPDLARRNGIPYLEKTLSNLLIRHIQECLPDLRDRISKKLKHYEETLKKCGNEVLDKDSAAMEIIGEFSENVKNLISGSNIEIDTDLLAETGEKNLTGGPAIRQIFDEKFAKSIQRIEAQISKDKIIEYLKICGGPRASLFPSEELFHKITMLQIERLREPSLACAENVKIELERVIKDCVEVKASFHVKQYPVFMLRLKNIMLKFIDDQMQKTRDFITNCINVELSCINTNHPEFLELKESITKNQCNKSSTASGGAGDSNKRGYSLVMNDDEENEIGDETVKNIKLDAENIEKFIKCYFGIEKEKIEDSIPKSIICTLVNVLTKETQAHLMKTMYKQANELLAETEDIAQTRKEAVIMIKALRTASEHVEEVSEMSC